MGDGTKRRRMIGVSQSPILSHAHADFREPIITRDESHLLRATVSDILVFAPPLSSRPSTRLKCDGIIRGLFISNPTAAPAGSTPSQSSAAYSEAAVAIWFGERKGAPAALALYTLSSLVGEGGDPEKTEHRHLPMTTARKAFYQADKLSVKWNAAGTMVSGLRYMTS